MKLTASIGVILAVVFGAYGQSAVDTASVSKGALVSESDSGNLTIYVSNHSRARPEVPIDLWFDDTKYISSTFAFRDQHNFVKYEFEVPTGMHRLAATTNDMEVEVSLDMSDKQWVAVGYWYDPDKDDVPNLSLLHHDQPFDIE